MENLKETKLPTYDGEGMFDGNGITFYGISAPESKHNSIQIVNIIKVEDDLLFVHFTTDDNIDMTSATNKLKFVRFDIPNFDPQIRVFQVFNWHNHRPVADVSEARAIITACRNYIEIKSTEKADFFQPEKCGNGVLTMM